MEMTLHTVQDDFVLNAGDDVHKESMTFPGVFYLLDTAGNYLVDTAGNRLAFYEVVTETRQVLNTLQDDFVLNTE